MEKKTEDQLVLATKIITPILLVSITGGIAFWFYKRQNEIKKLHDEEISRLESEKELVEEKMTKVEEVLEKKEQQLHNAVFDDVDTSGAVGEIVENAEFAEMRKRYTQQPPVEVFKPEAEIVSHNAWEEALVTNPDDNDGEVTLEDIKAHEEKKEVVKSDAVEVKTAPPVEEDSLKMIYEKNSNEAFKGFKAWLLADIDFEDIEAAIETVESYGLDFAPGEGNDVAFLLDSLMNIPATATNDYDANITEVCMDKRIEFFGSDSVYSEGPVSIGEILLYWAIRLSEDTDDSSVWAYLAQFINNLDLYNANNLTQSQMFARIESVMAHTYTTPNGLMGIFGLTQEQVESIMPDERRFQTQYNAYLNDILNFFEANTAEGPDTEYDD